MLRGDAPIVVVQELKDGRDEWRNFSGDGVVKDSEIFVVDGLGILLDEGSFKQ